MSWKGVFFYFFALYFKTAPRIFPIFFMSVEDNRGHCLSKIVFWKISILDYRGLSDQKRCLSYLLGLYLKTALEIFPIFFMSVEDNRPHSLSKIASQKKFSIPHYRGLVVQTRCFLCFFCLYSKTALKIFPIFCMSVEDNKAHCLSKVVFLKNS